MFDCLKSKARRTQLGYGTAPIIPTPAPVVATGGWQAGPVLNGQNYSVGTICDPNTGSFIWPIAQKGLDRWSTPGPHYLTRPTAGLAGSVISLDYEVTGDGEFFGTVGGQSSFAELSAYFQAAGDDWSGKAGQAFRWWSKQTFPLTVGRHAAEIPLTLDAWNVWPGPGGEAEFELAKRTAVNVGVTFGNDEAKGHGLSSPTGNSSFVLHRFAVL